MAWGLLICGPKQFDPRPRTEHSVQTPLLIATLIGLTACGGGLTAPGEEGEDVSRPPTQVREGDSAEPSVGNPSWMPLSSDIGSGDTTAIALKGDPGAEAKTDAGAPCDEVCAADSVCDPTSGGCVPHCSESPCVSGWSCDGSTGLCAADHPSCGLCREGQVRDPALGVCVSNCAWAGCSGGQCDRDTGFCVE